MTFRTASGNGNCYNVTVDMGFKRMTTARGVLAVVSTAIEETGIWAVWRFLLPAWGINLSTTVLIVMMSLWMAFSIWLFMFTTFVLKKQEAAGPPSMVGQKGKAASPLSPGGMVRIKGELWSARAVDGTIAAGEEITVVGEDRLVLQVTRLVPGP